ncbi:upstream activation factor subunit UAF30-like [Phalaenopsis equestris]|uniref:upstream activation factor subunit UAF30-like n=1 Tax=Phalaenopsis equestris TaxID=78828 RepID=UPI0009E26E0B|nr:upstream activation factor subunit UAF30-like [Phalaenopsis equestris]
MIYALFLVGLTATKQFLHIWGGGGGFPCGSIRLREPVAEVGAESNYGTKKDTLSYRASASTKTIVISEDTGPRRPARGITKPKPVSPAMQAFLGVKEIPRTQALKQIWAYIKENNLQDPENKKIVVCDEKLKSILGGRDRVGFLEISGLLNPHFFK